MLHEFLRANRTELIDRCRGKVSMRRAPRATPDELEHGIPLFLDQLADMLGSGTTDGRPPALRGSVSGEARIGESAKRHGAELLRHDFTIDQVVHDYGDLCQSITELAGEKSAPITVAEFGNLNIRLDNAIADAVTEFARGREVMQAEGNKLAMNEHIGTVAHEMRNLINTAILAVAAIKGGSVGFGGATAAALDRSLIGMRALVDRTLAEVRLGSGAPPLRETVELAGFIAEMRVVAALEASQKGCGLTVLPVLPGIYVEADRHILTSAVSNILQNAFKFTRPGTHVILRAYASKGRVLIDVEDECGGVPAEVEGLIFRPFEQHGADRSGVGLGLSLSREGVEEIGGKLSMRNIPGRGCVFTIDLPRRS